MDNIIINNSISDLNKNVTTYLLQLLEKKNRISICLSGGSTPKALFDFWSDTFKNDIPWKNISFYWGDERCVPPEDDMSNYGMTKKHLFDKIDVPPENIFRIYGENDPANEAKRYGKIIPDKFDLIMLGMGDDGHTASIFPNQIKMWDSPDNCIVATHPETGMKRISITGKIIDKAENVAFLITGAGKAQKVKEILQNRDRYISLYPAAKVMPQSGNLYWFLDKESGSLL